ncbi:hypothetical protein CEW89_08745 [Celeribacter ethanolicus]|uniref:Uncharacterized protein n=1 Tax=Celeribacter ethanolicus TaxID=1758178 RepID=A0A291GAU0_9RHOB|nr:hypothetical protein [Celeribacter ethanolicus]ATG47653.1 hypothetical protein CEW89_08745 [Celeribacter ethanolicus]
MPYTLTRTRPFRNLQSRIGSATYRLNTILVGLQQVAGGADKTEDLPVSWSKPSPAKAKQVADQARIFACSAAVAFAYDGFDSFIRAIVREDWLSFSQSTIEIATKSVTKKGGEAYSMSERLEKISQELNIESPLDTATVELFAKWRNLVVHDRDDSSRGLSIASEEALSSSSDYFYKNYSHLDINLALKNFSARKMPVPKEATSLIALAQNLARRVDEAAINRVASTPTDFEKAALVLVGQHYKLAKGRHPTPAAAVAEAWQGDVVRREKNLERVLVELGISKEQKKPVSASLPEDFIPRMAGLDIEDFAKKIGVH